MLHGGICDKFERKKKQHSIGFPILLDCKY